MVTVTVAKYGIVLLIANCQRTVDENAGTFMTDIKFYCILSEQDWQIVEEDRWWGFMILGEDFVNCGRDQREWAFEVREVKSEIKKLSLFFEKCKVKKKCFHSFSRSAKWNQNAFTLFREVKSEIKMLRDRDREVKILENSEQFSRNEIFEQVETSLWGNLAPNKVEELTIVNENEEKATCFKQNSQYKYKDDFNHIGVRIDYNRMDDDLEEELDAAEYEDFDDAEEESEEEE